MLLGSKAAHIVNSVAHYRELLELITLYTIRDGAHYTKN